jgi:hypothetical protein
MNRLFHDDAPPSFTRFCAAAPGRRTDEPPPGAVYPMTAARKRAREELIDSMTRDWTVDEIETLLERKRRAVQV